MKWILNVVYVVMLTMLSPVILWRSLRHGRYRRGWTQKLFGNLPVFSVDRPVVWFHAVSVGEVLQLQKVVEEFRRATHGDFQILITTSTDTGFEVAAARFSECVVSWLPLDFSWAVENALRRVQPKLVVLVELELWPNFLKACTKCEVKTALINARMSDRSFSGYSLFARLTKSWLRQFSLVAAQSQEYADRLIQLGTRPEITHVTGSVKFDGALCERTNPGTSELRRLFHIADSEVVMIAGSTQAPEEQLALGAWQKLRCQHSQLRLILVPRHRERFDEVARLIEGQNLPLVRRSTLTDSDTLSSGAVILLDTIGELGACWGLADIAFVGGSFGTRGGQNMLEPAAYGAAVVFGPNTWNFKDIVERLLQAGGARQLLSQDEVVSEVSSLLTDPVRRTQMGTAAREFVVSQQGAIAETVSLLTEVIRARDTRSQRAAA